MGLCEFDLKTGHTSNDGIVPRSSSKCHVAIDIAGVSPERNVFGV